MQKRKFYPSVNLCLPFKNRYRPGVCVQILIHESHLYLLFISVVVLKNSLRWMGRLKKFKRRDHVVAQSLAKLLFWFPRQRSVSFSFCGCHSEFRRRTGNSRIIRKDNQLPRFIFVHIRNYEQQVVMITAVRLPRNSMLQQATKNFMARWFIWEITGKIIIFFGSCGRVNLTFQLNAFCYFFLKKRSLLPNFRSERYENKVSILLGHLVKSVLMWKPKAGTF